jgi:PIN domain nuclease of toxin-antitoxin system
VTAARAVLDSSVVLAFLFGEPGREAAKRLLPTGFLLSVNLAEVVTKLLDEGVPAFDRHAIVGNLGCEIIPFDRDLAIRAGDLRSESAGLSLGDRACLALALARGLPVYTAERAWADLKLGIDIRLIR